MRRPIPSRFALLLALAGLSVGLVGLHAEDKPKAEGAKPQAAAAVQPKPLSEAVKKGLAYLAGQQHPDGGWGQGGGWRSGSQNGRVEGPNVQDPSDVANTCMAALVLLRAGNTPREGEYAKQLANAVEFICGHVQRADKDSLYITPVRDTQVQVKIGPYVDTFLASLVLAEVKGRMPEEKAEQRLKESLEKTVAKIEKHQKEDGTFAGNTGWASIFSQGLASKGLNRARQMGVAVKDETLARAEKNAVASVDLQTGAFKAAGGGAAGLGGFAARSASGRAVGGIAATAPAAGPTDAGVSIYNASNQTAALQEAVNTNKELEKRAKEVLARRDATPAEKTKAQTDLDRVANVEQAQKVAVGSIVRQLDDKRFLQGFGSNGGEEFLSYLNISETLVVKGGDEWTKWDKSITDNLTRIQNKDGSWSGDHCITGRTFCTSAALLVLMADRAPIPVAARIQPQK